MSNSQQEKEEYSHSLAEEADTRAWPNTEDDDLERSISQSAPVEPAEAYVEEHKSQPPSNILARTISRRSAASSLFDPGPPPDGGAVAWTQVLCTHLTIFSTFGYITSFGVFQTYYETVLDVDPSTISWIGSVQLFLLFFIGTVSGRATDAGLFKWVYVIGSIFQLVGIFCTAEAQKFWQLFLAQAICSGIANGLHFCPAMSLLTTYFAKKRAFVVGIAALGSCTGGVVIPIVVQQLLPRIGFPWTARVIGFVM